MKGSDVSQERRAGGMDPLVLLGGRPGQEGGVHSDGPYPQKQRIGGIHTGGAGRKKAEA